MLVGCHDFFLPNTHDINYKNSINKIVSDHRKIANLLFAQQPHQIRDQSYACKVVCQLVEKEQEARRILIQKAKDPLVKNHIQTIDQLNQSAIIFILKHYNNWIISKTPDDMCEQNMWLLVLHAPNVSFQKRVMHRLKQLVEAKKSHPRFYAYLYDKVAIKLNKRQKFGTQIEYDNNQKKWVISPVDDEINLAKNREKMGLEPIYDYLDTVNKMYKDYTPK